MLGTVLGGGTYVRGGEKVHVLARIDLDRGEVTTTVTPFLPHAVAFHPDDPGTITIFEKKGPGAALVRDGEVTPFAPSEGRHFYGHGAYVDGGILAVESTIGGGSGALVLRDRDSLRPLGEIPSHGVSPHDCWLLDGGVLAVTNGGGVIRAGDAGNIAFVELPSGRLLHRHEIGDERFNAGHLWTDADGRLIVISAPRDGLPTPSQQQGAVSFGKRGSRLDVAEAPKAARRQMLGESLSVVVLGARAFVTHPDGDLVTVWDDGKLVGTLSFPQPRGLALAKDGSTLFVSHVRGGSVVLTAVNPVTLSIEEKPRIDPSFTSGSHLFVVP